jgi:hypothetical protein
MVRPRLSSCAPTFSDAPPLAVIGILSTPSRRAFRDASRQTWHRRLPASMPSWFALRGLGLPHNSAVYDEAAAHGDVILLAAQSNLSRALGPLHSVYLWYRCAVRMHAAAPFVGRLDDDTWLHVPAVEALLAALVPRAREGDELWVGTFEGYSWDEASGQPIGWAGYFPTTTTCVARGRAGGAPADQRANRSVVGPFNFAKGAASFLSTGLARALAPAPTHSTAADADADRSPGPPSGDAPVRPDAVDARCLRGSVRFWAQGGVQAVEEGERTVRRCGFTDAELARPPRWGTLPYEDVWLGYALSQAPPVPAGRERSGRVVVIHLSTELFQDDWVRAARDADARVALSSPRPHVRRVSSSIPTAHVPINT